MRRLLVLTTVLAALFLSACSLTLPTTADGSKTTDEVTTDSTATTDPAGTTTMLTTEGSDPMYQALFENANYHKFTISFSRENFDKLIYDMENYNDQFGSYRDNTIQEVDITYEDGHGNVIEEYEVGFRTRGNIFSRRLPIYYDNYGKVAGYQQVSFQLEFNDTFDYPVNSTEYKALDQRRMFDLEQLNFKYIRDWDTSAITEIAGYELYRAAGLVAPDTALTVVYFDIDGEIVPYGLFVMVEPIDDVFVRRYFGKNQDDTIGDLWKCVWQNGGPATLQKLNPGDYDGLGNDRLGLSDYNLGYRYDYQLKTNKTTSDWSSMLTFMDRLNDTSAVNYQNVLESILDVDTWLKSLAMAYLVGNPDDYRSNANNYYIYFYENRAVYITYDNDQCLGFGWNPYAAFGESYTIGTDIYNYRPVNNNWLPKENFPLVVNVLQFEAYQKVYEDYLMEFTAPGTGIFNYESFRAEFVLARELYQTEITTGFHLGLNTFSLANRTMNAEDYYAAKIEFTRASVEYYRNH